MTKDNYPSYPGGDYHPENDDNPQNPYGSGAPGYGAPGDPYGSAAGYAGAAATPVAGGNRLVQGDGKTRAMESISYGFRAVFASPLAWIVSALGVGILSMLAFGVTFAAMFSRMSADGAFDPETGATPDPNDYQMSPLLMIFFLVIMVVAQVMFANAALKAADGRKITFGDFYGGPNFGKAIVFVVIVNLIVSALPYLLPGALQVILNAAMVFLGPLYMLMYLYVLDQGASFGDAVKRGFKAGTRNYLSLLGFSIVWGIIIIISAIPLGLGMIITMPAYMAALAYVYRQASGGVYPED
ncbi:hypothetical protein [Corynebacterium pygosceleis]|uniref:DUF975 family protein n=1 Tax=Corynebacterium pygosceleis TaxID=2800406 RepID=A0ABT3WR29_9CORY|nr:hypothetical protein [Corynebacterium pygosceleis]MCK7674947.1 hypothetical protein [Corynebacterium pygosceleis]MCL0119464.1 hypothetical protein [Corynebacterium pygosceleis]MCX7444704.1 hypothetical protein [Corynebacterium pygosceleis]